MNYIHQLHDTFEQTLADTSAGHLKGSKSLVTRL